MHNHARPLTYIHTWTTHIAKKRKKGRYTKKKKKKKEREKNAGRKIKKHVQRGTASLGEASAIIQQEYPVPFVTALVTHRPPLPLVLVGSGHADDPVSPSATFPSYHFRAREDEYPNLLLFYFCLSSDIYVERKPIFLFKSAKFM